MLSFKRFLCVCALATMFSTGAVNAEPAWKPKQPPQYMVSGLLVQQGEAGTKKLYHVLVLAATEAEAEAKFAEAVKQNFPGFALNTVVATRVPAMGKCEIDI